MKFNGSAGATALVGMPGFVVGASRVVDGELHLDVETTASMTACPECGVRAVGHGRRRVKIRDLPISGRPTVLCWAKRIWRCKDPDCATATWSETSEAVEPSGLLTVRAGAELCRVVGEDDWTVALAGRRFGISWPAAMKRVRVYGTPLVDDPARLETTTAIGVDETTFLHSGRRRRTQYVTGIIDLDRGRLLDVVPGRSGRVLIDWLFDQSTAWRDQITIAAIDAFRGYANGLAAALPDAVLVMDHFHTIRLANRVVDQVRRRTNNVTLGHRGRRHDPLYRIRRIALVGSERLDQDGWDRLIAGIDAGDPTGELDAAWAGKELLRNVYKAADPQAARRALTAFYTHVADHDHIGELVTLARTVDAWETEILAYHHTARASNGPTEAVNLLIEKTRRIGHGFRNFNNYRLRLLLACGAPWNTPPVARLRGRQTTPQRVEPHIRPMKFGGHGEG
ncbi:MAG TPA: ISL3 family transposase [Acidimicrobiales bacterium]|nr:ISL3 family transposase [Acidimicrobiales bacterium]